MNFTKEPSIETKIAKMKERVRWQHPQLVQRNIDQTQLAIDDNSAEDEAFSFLVLGDSGTGRHRHDSPQREVAKQLVEHSETARFLLHTGDVVYLLGASSQYLENFIKPYREFLMGGENPEKIAYDQMVFKLPFLPVLGNHDYYDIPPLLGLLSGLTTPLRYLLRRYIDLDVGWHGSFQGDAYARAFIDYLTKIPAFKLAQHFEQHYTTQTEAGHCLTYQSGIFTRIPNRYYTFRYGGIDFFALDSNTFNQPSPASQALDNGETPESLQAQQQQLNEEKQQLLQSVAELNYDQFEEGDEIEDIMAEVEEVDEQINDINKQLSNFGHHVVDEEQLQWLEQRLIASWQNPTVRGRILFFHHPPYVTEASKHHQGQTLAVRYHLRRVLNTVAQEVGELAQGQPLVNLILSGHAHCLEYLRTEETGYGDANLNWIICGGSGYSLRRQKKNGADLTEKIDGKAHLVAKNHLFVGRSGKGSHLRRPYSALRIDVKQGKPLQLEITPLIAEKYRKHWHHYCLKSFVI